MWISQAHESMPGAADGPPRLAIVVVSHNSRAELDGLLESLTRPAPRLSHEIVVVDNASTDGTTEALRGSWPAVRVIDAGANVGFAGACNIGIRSTRGELVLLLNPDTVVPPGAVDGLAAELDRHPEAAAVGPRLVDAQGRAELSFGSMISPWNELRQKLLVRLNDRGFAPVCALVERMTRRPSEVDWVSGACLLARRADLEAVGLLDDRFFLYTEDVDLCASFRAHGRTVRFSPSTEVVHLRGRSVGRTPRGADAGYRRSQLAFYQKHHPGWLPVLRAYLRMRGELPEPDSGAPL